MQIKASDLGRLNRAVLGAVEYRHEVVDITRYGVVVARIVPADVWPPSVSVVPRLESAQETTEKTSGSDVP
jgi:antitoxin (DNA-binding transcriptional repressor) of toxin-antitoxin stability system